jgi:hypothetical protein
LSRPTRKAQNYSAERLNEFPVVRRDLRRHRRLFDHLCVCPPSHQNLQTGWPGSFLRQLSFYLLGVLLWLAYGIILHVQAVALTNLATAIFIAAATLLKAWKERQPTPESAQSDSDLC